MRRHGSGLLAAYQALVSGNQGSKGTFTVCCHWLHGRYLENLAGYIVQFGNTSHCIATDFPADAEWMTSHMHRPCHKPSTWGLDISTVGQLNNTEAKPRSRTGPYQAGDKLLSVEATLTLLVPFTPSVSYAFFLTLHIR